MRSQLVVAAALMLYPANAWPQEIVQVPASEAGVSLPEDIFGLPPGQWFIARQVSQGNESCTAEACEAGINAGDLAVSVERAKGFVQVIAGFRGCPAVAFQEVETGLTPGSSRRGEVSRLVKKVIKAAEISCKVKAPKVPKLDVAALFPAKGG